MIQYIDKEKVIEEIKKLYKEDYKFLPSDIVESVGDFKDELLMVLDNLSTVEEVDLEKEIDATYPTEHITRTLIEEVIPTFEGEQWQGKFSIIPFYLSICQKARIQGFSTEGYRWFDIGKPDTLALAEASLSK